MLAQAAHVDVPAEWKGHLDRVRAAGRSVPRGEQELGEADEDHAAGGDHRRTQDLEGVVPPSRENERRLEGHGHPGDLGEQVPDPGPSRR